MPNSFNIAPYIAKYVRSLHAHEDAPEIPYRQTQFGVVLMVDVVGFSTLTTLATQRGDSGAEAIALEVGGYMGECIRIIEFYGGDVVKFLGDAVLVSFQPHMQDISTHATTTAAPDVTNDATAEEVDARTKTILVRRALECGLQLLTRLSHYRVYLTAEERSRHRDVDEVDGTVRQDANHYTRSATTMNGNEEGRQPSISSQSQLGIPLFTNSYPEETSMSFSIWNILSFLRPKRRPLASRRTSISSDSSNRDINTVDLELHIALACGDVTNIVIGDVGHQDSIQHSSSLRSARARKRISRLSRIGEEGFEYADNDRDADEEQLKMQRDGRLEYAICGEAVEGLDEALAVAKAGEMSVTPAAWKLINPQSLDLHYEKRHEFMIVRQPPETATTKKTSTGKAASKHNGGTAPDRTGDRSLPLNITSKLNLEPLIPKVRNTSFLELSTETNPHYYKYLNRSVLHRLRQSDDGNFPAQFRDATIMFISLGKLKVWTDDGIKRAQTAMTKAIKCLVKYEGMLQQFAVDDKGATILAVFGLPPLSHEREAVFAAKAAVELREEYLDAGFSEFAISLSTGLIFNAVLPQGNPFRRDPGISGDTIVLAVRMLKFDFSSQNVVCDLQTKQQIGGLCEFEDMGENYVKGKAKPIQIFRIMRFGDEKNKRISIQGVGKSSDFIGYKQELAKATQFIDEWNVAKNQHVLIISGPSGVGKSYFCQAIHKMVNGLGVYSCWSTATEVEKGTKFYVLKNILLGLFEILEQDKIPISNQPRSIQGLNDNLSSNTSNGARLSTYIGNGAGPSAPQSNSVVTNAGNAPTFLPLAPMPTKESQMPNLSRSQSLTVSSSTVGGDWYKLKPMNSAVSPPGASAQVRNEVTTELIDLILKCLRKAGEDESYLPLFKGVFTTLGDVEENRFTRKLDGRGRDILFTGLIVRMIRYITEYVSIMIVSDDVQWADSASIRVLETIHDACPRALMMLATRPIKDYNVTFIKELCSFGSCAQITLNGLNGDEIGEIIINTFQSGVKRVSPEIIRVIQNRTGGNPLYVKNMAIILKDFNHVTLVEGELVPSSNKFDLEDLLGNFDYKRIIKMQFDRLHVDYQEFLTVASCLDQSFGLSEIQAVIKSKNSIFQSNDSEIIRHTIKKYDVYNFLLEIGETNLVDKNEDVFSFAHVTIPQSIYDMAPYEKRISLHKALARYYESQLTRDNYPQLLAKVTRHYLETDWYGKQLYYLEALADLNMRSYFLAEATSNLERMVKILDENEELAEEFGRMHRSDIYRMLGMCLTMRTKLAEGEHYLFLALQCLDSPWPRSDLEFGIKFWRNRFVQYRHRKYARMTMIDKPLKERKAQSAQRIVEIMAQLSNIYFYTGKGRDFIYSCLIGLNACERLRDTGPTYSLFLARFSLVCWLNDQKDNSIFYITKALQQVEEKADAGTFTTCAFMCFAAGKFENARNLLYLSIQVVKVFGVVTDCQAFYRSVGLAITMRIFEGTLDQSPAELALLKQMADTAHMNGDYEAEIWLSVYHICNGIVVDRIRDCEPFVVLVEAHLKQAADYNKIAMHGALIAYYARAGRYDLAKRHLRYLNNVLPTLTVTANIFPIFGLILATMGLYEMIEDNQTSLIGGNDAQAFEKFINAIARLNRAFQQVKFWEFTQPCLFLARALPYISTGRTVEGFLVLRHGIMDMHFIDEVRFLKAYFWSKLGKYAFTPEDRIEWTRRAEQEFKEIHIPHDAYCNPNPGEDLMLDFLRRHSSTRTATGQMRLRGEDGRQGYDSSESNTAVATQETSDCGTHTINTDTHGLPSNGWEDGSIVTDGVNEATTSPQKSTAVEDVRCEPKSPSEMERNGKGVGVNVT